MAYFSEEQIQEMVAKAEASLVANMVSATQQAVESRVRWALDSKIAETVNEFFNAELKDKLVAELHAQRDVMAQQIVACAITIGQSLAEKIVERAQKNIASEYNSGQIFDKLFAR